MEKTLVLIKPDGVKRHLIGEIIRRIEEEGLQILNMRMVKLTRNDAEEFYSVHKGKDFFEKLIEHITSGRIVAIELGGDSIVERVRKLIGKTDPNRASPDTIRGALGLNKTDNTVHASDSEEHAEREIEFFFGKEEG